MASVTSTSGSFTPAPLAKGPLPKPDGMRGATLARVRRWSLPCAVACVAVFGAMFYGTFYRRKQKIDEYYRTTNPHELFEEIKEYGVFKSVKASWQEE